MSLHTLILAAGRSSRFGNSPKQLALVNEQTLLERSINLAKAIGETTVVLGYEHDRLMLLVKGAHIVVNPNWHEGIGSSIAYGVAALPANVSAVLILLCDQAAITSADLNVLCNRYKDVCDHINSTPIVCASYANGVGVPAIFPRRFFAQLMALSGDLGAKKLLQNDAVISVPMERAATDIDTQESWIQFTKAYQNNKGDYQ